MSSPKSNSGDNEPRRRKAGTESSVQRLRSQRLPETIRGEATATKEIWASHKKGTTPSMGIDTLRDRRQRSCWQNMQTVQHRRGLLRKEAVPRKPADARQGSTGSRTAVKCRLPNPVLRMLSLIHRPDYSTTRYANQRTQNGVRQTASGEICSGSTLGSDRPPNGLRQRENCRSRPELQRTTTSRSDCGAELHKQHQQQRWTGA